jgi:hypothetical protein
MSLALCVGRPSFAQSDRASDSLQALALYRNRVLGVFAEHSGDPLADTEILDLATGMRASTTSTGTVGLAFVRDGGSMLRIRKLGYRPQTLWAAISPADTTPITVVLTPLGQALPVVTVLGRGGRDSIPHWMSPGLREFEERRKIGLGHFLSEDLLRKEEDRTLGNVLMSHVVELKVVERAFGRTWLMSTRNPSCQPDIYENGIRISTPTGRMDISKLFIKDFSAIEFHNPSTAPEMYLGTGSSCGVLLLWSRER